MPKASWQLGLDCRGTRSPLTYLKRESDINKLEFARNSEGRRLKTERGCSSTGRDLESTSWGRMVEKKKCSKNAKMSQNGNGVLNSGDRVEDLNGCMGQ